MPSRRVLAAAVLAAARCIASEPQADELSLVQRFLEPAAEAKQLQEGSSAASELQAELDQWKSWAVANATALNDTNNKLVGLAKATKEATKAQKEYDSLQRRIIQGAWDSGLQADKERQEVKKEALKWVNKTYQEKEKAERDRKAAQDHMSSAKEEAVAAKKDAEEWRQKMKDSQQEIIRLRKDLTKAMEELREAYAQSDNQATEIKNLTAQIAQLLQTKQAAPVVPGLAQLGRDFFAKADPAGMSALQVEASAVDESDVAHFKPDNLMVCVEGSTEYMRAALAKIKSSPVGPGYEQAQLTAGSCLSEGYDIGPKPDQCFPKMTVHRSREHPLQPLSEMRLIAQYGFQHGAKEAKAALEEMCKPL